MQLSLYTQEYFFQGKIKRAIKTIFGKDNRGPEAVVAGLLNGLDKIAAPYSYNTDPKDQAVAGVLNGVKVLRWAIEQKKQGKIARIAAGTNIVVLPSEENGILSAPEIDAVLVPCLWVQKAYEKDTPSLKGKIFVWPAGVEVPDFTAKSKDYDFLIYNKQSSGTLLNSVVEILNKKQLHNRVISYGKFHQQEYFSLLEKSRYLIYLGGTESQGIAMFEAWARDVPTLVYGKHDSSGETASPSPYLSFDSGMFLSDILELPAKLEQFMSQKFSARQYVMNNFTLQKSAEQYLAIIKSIT